MHSTNILRQLFFVFFSVQGVLTKCHMNSTPLSQVISGANSTIFLLFMLFINLHPILILTQIVMFSYNNLFTTLTMCLLLLPRR